MVRRLVIPIDIPATVVAGIHPRGRFVTDPAADEEGLAPGGTEGQSGAELRRIESDAFAAAVVHSKVRSPAIRPSTLERQRLLDWLERHASARLRVITTEAGYGKSTLLADHARRTNRRTVWYRLETSDRDWVTFLSYIVASVREVAPGFGSGTVSLLQQVGVLNATRDLTLDTLLAELESVATEPLSMVLDDFHTVHDSEDVRAIVARFLEHAPPGLSLVIAGRDRPAIPLARLAAQAGVAELTTEDLRFTRSETADLFTHSYGTPIDDDLVDAIDRRLEGWGASLQLVCASLLALRPEEIRAFVRDLSAHSEPLYDFLAEEVITRQTPVMRRVLTHASLLERISPHLLAAATADPRPVSLRQIAVCLYRAEDAGMISRIATGNGRWRFHPLIREYLRDRLLSSLSVDERMAMHLRVAVAAEPSDWLAATHHFLEAGHPEEGMRVLRDAAIQALGTASWGQAIDLIDRAGDHPPVVAAAIIQARSLIADGQPDTALVVLNAVDMSSARDLERALAGMTQAAALYAQSRSDELKVVLDAIVGDESTPMSVMGIADAWLALLRSSDDGPLLPVARTLRALAARHRSAGLPYFAGISLNNAMCVELARGSYSDAVGLGRDALDQFSHLPVLTSELASMHSTLALSLAESGNMQAAWDQVEIALSVSRPQPDALGDVAWLAAAAGRPALSWSCLRQAARILDDGHQELGSDVILAHANVILALSQGDVGGAEAELVTVIEPDSALSGDRVRGLTLRALVACALRRPEAAALAGDGLALARRQGAWRWEPRLRVLHAIATGNRSELPALLAEAAASGPLPLLELADVIAQNLDLASAGLEAIEQSVKDYPTRWLPALRRSLSSGATSQARVAAQLIARHGTKEDLTVLFAWEQTYARQGKQRTLSATLSRRVTPVLHLRDLGRTEFSVDSHSVFLSQVRRKAAALLLFLASRPDQTAGRESVLDALWPDATPHDALNSLHQALYYLRRCIDQWYEDSTSPDYVVLESELVYLDPNLVTVDSVLFNREASMVIGSQRMDTSAIATIAAYRGVFALEFEYEEWAIDYRTQTHALYLRLVQEVAEAQIAAKDYHDAAAGLELALRIDPTAFELGAHLVKALWHQGSRAAAVEHYKLYARLHERELALVPPSLDALL